MPTLAELLQQALDLHRSQQFEPARHLYEQALALDPHQAHVLNMLGLLAGQRGDWTAACDYLRRAIAIDGSQAIYHANLAEALNGAGDRLQAEQCFRQAMSPNAAPEIFTAYAVFLQRSARVDEAIAAYREALELNPQFVAAQFNLATALEQQGDFVESERNYRRTLDLRNDHFDALNNLGTLLMNQGKLAAAEACWHRALEVKPRAASVYCSLGNNFQKQDNLEQAIVCYREAVAIQPDYSQAESNLGNALRDVGLPCEALHVLERAVAQHPDTAIARSNLAAVLQDLGRPDAARRHLERAIELDPSELKFQLNLGSVLMTQGFPTVAVACYDHVLRKHPTHAEAQFLRGATLLLLGHFAEGWAGYEYRFGCQQFRAHEYEQPRWKGEPLGSRTLMIHWEQGLGDTLHFMRYVNLVREREKNVVVLVQKILKPLLAASGFTGMVTKDDPMPPFDVELPLLSLPYVFKTDLDSIPHDVPYLAADPARVADSRGELNRYSGLKVGIAWQGNPTHNGDRIRSVPLACFAPLAGPDVRLFSLQKLPGSEQIAELGGQFEVIDFSDRLDTEGGAFMDTAAIMKNLDLVITSDTATAHLAGGLGVPVWVAVSASPEWRWLLNRDDSPWYPTMRLFRQTRLLHWGDVFASMAEELRKFRPSIRS